MQCRWLDNGSNAFYTNCTLYSFSLQLKSTPFPIKPLSVENWYKLMKCQWNSETPITDYIMIMYFIIPEVSKNRLGEWINCTKELHIPQYFLSPAIHEQTQPTGPSFTCPAPAPHASHLPLMPPTCPSCLPAPSGVQIHCSALTPCQQLHCTAQDA